MVTLKNIQRTEKEISCEFVPELEKQSGKMVMDRETLEVIYLYDPLGARSAAAHTRIELRRLAVLSEEKFNKIPKERPVMWY